ncbi:MAG: cellulase family glycosylhydrolase [Gemmataceae bacterium]
MNRREFVATAAAGLAAGVALSAEAKVSAAHLPRWRGFNLLEKFNHDHAKPFVETDFAWMAEWGFDFVRLPMSYRCWTDKRDWTKLREPALKDVDQAVEYGKKHGIHVNINFHRAPGYCVNPPAEPKSLWKDDEALDTCAAHWAAFARRYQGVPNERVSFDLLNEPGDIKEADYVRVVRRLVEAIRKEDPNRLVIADGLKWGTQAVPGLADLKIAQSTRGYQPMQISHYKAGWIRGSDKWPEPTWPLKEGKRLFDRAELRRRIEPWQALQKRGVGVHAGEWGAFSHTPHPVVLAWMHDQLAVWKEADWGWALWNFRGGFGILDSGRKDVKYESYRGHQLDRAMLDLLRAG